MAKNVGGVLLDTKVLEDIARGGLRKEAARIVEKYGLAITGTAAQIAPVDTGALKNSILSESGMKEELLFILQDGVEYGIFQELGTNKMAAQPFVIPALENWRQRFFDAFKELFDDK